MALRFQRLTRPAIRAMQPGDKLQEHGITVERQPNGDTRYSINIMCDGQRVHRVIGRESEGTTREQAERAIEKFKTEAREGRLDLPRGRKRHRTVAEAVPEYLERIEASGGKNMKNKRRHFKQHLVPFLGADRLDKLSELRLWAYRRRRGEQGAKPSTINRELATLSHLLSKAASTGQDGWRWIRPDQRPKVPITAEARKRVQILTPEQDDALLRAAVADHDPDLWLFVLFASNAAMRHEEITRRRFDEVDWTRCRLWIDKAKAGEREQPITPALRDALAQRREMVDDQDGWIFPSRTKAAKLPHRRSMAKQFRRAVIAAGLDPKKVTPHILRHTGISRVLMAGADLKTAQRISGHKTVAMLMHYAHVLDPHVDRFVNVLNRPLPDTITPELHTPENEGQGSAAEVVPISQGRTAA